MNELNLKNLYMALPIENKWFSLEQCEIIDMVIEQPLNDDGTPFYYDTGEVYVIENLIMLDEEPFWYKGEKGIDNKLYSKVQEHFTTPKFNDILKSLYKELLAGKVIASTANSYMFIQRFSYISNFEFD